MACTLTASFAIACRDSKGGVQEVLITELENKNTFTVTAGEVTAFTLDTGKKFWVYEQEIEKASFTENIQTSRENNSFFSEQDASLIIFKGSVAARNEIMLLGQNRLMIIIKDNNGVYWLVGAVNGARLEPSTFATGTAFGDMNGYTLNFKAKEADMAYTVSPTLIASLKVNAT